MPEGIAPPVVVQQRPVWVWVIFVFYLVSAGWGLLLQCLMVLGLYTLSAQQQALVGNLTPAARLFAVAMSLLNITAATSLWLLRRVAFPLFTLIVVLGLGTIVKQLLPGGMYNTMLGQGVLIQVATIFSVGVGALLSLAIWWYVWSLRRRGVLK